MAKSRRKAREAALVALYQLDLLKARLDPSVVVADVCAGMELPEDQSEYAKELVGGIAQNRSRVDQVLGQRLEEYDITRVAAVDRAILRIATYEVLFVPWLAPAITVNEAVELAKRYSTAESGRFVNGVLRQLVRESDKATWDPESAPAEAVEEPAEEPEPEVVEEQLDPESDETQKLLKIGWKIRSDD